MPQRKRLIEKPKRNVSRPKKSRDREPPNTSCCAINNNPDIAKTRETIKMISAAIAK
jgi:hypothetical protein